MVMNINLGNDMSFPLDPPYSPLSCGIISPIVIVPLVSQPTIIIFINNSLYNLHSSALGHINQYRLSGLKHTSSPA
jgi:hypothetical protein